MGHGGGGGEKIRIIYNAAGFEKWMDAVNGSFSCAIRFNLNRMQLRGKELNENHRGLFALVQKNTFFYKHFLQASGRND